jgi:hypothetical protein
MDTASGRKVDLHLWIDQKEALAVRRIAAARRWPLSQIVRDAISEYLAREGSALAMEPECR